MGDPRPDDQVQEGKLTQDTHETHAVYTAGIQSVTGSEATEVRWNGGVGNGSACLSKCNTYQYKCTLDETSYKETLYLVAA